MLNKIVNFFKTGVDLPSLTDKVLVKRIYEKKRWSVYISLIIGYGFFYTTRLSL